MRCVPRLRTVLQSLLLGDVMAADPGGATSHALSIGILPTAFASTTWLPSQPR
jgi:hypothetical protein